MRRAAAPGGPTNASAADFVAPRSTTVPPSARTSPPRAEAGVLPSADEEDDMLDPQTKKRTCWIRQLTGGSMLLPTSYLGLVEKLVEVDSVEDIATVYHSTFQPSVRFRFRTTKVLSGAAVVLSGGDNPPTWWSVTCRVELEHLVRHLARVLWQAQPRWVLTLGLSRCRRRRRRHEALKGCVVDFNK